MKKDWIFLLTGFLVWLALPLMSQDSPFSFSVKEQAYVPLRYPVSLTLGQPWNDPELIIPIGFDFSVLGVSTDRLYLNHKGGVVSTKAEAEGIGLVFGIFDDLMDRAFYDNMCVSDIAYELSGVPGRKVLKIQWSNVGFAGEMQELGFSKSFMNFQLWLYEGSNRIELRFGQTLVSSPEMAFNRYTGPLIGFLDGNMDELGNPFHFWSLTGDPHSPRLQGLKSMWCRWPVALQGTPFEGAVYRFGGDPGRIAPKVVAQPELPLDLWPNPAIELVSYRLGAGVQEEEEVLIRLFGPDGTVRAEEITRNGQGQLDLQDMEPGCYYLQAYYSGKLLVSRKFIRQ